MKPLSAQDVMTKEVLMVPADLPVNKLAEFLVDKGISGAPVISEDGQLIGAVSLTDVARHTSLAVHDPRTHHPDTAYPSDPQEHFAWSKVLSLQLKIDDTARACDIMTPMVFDVHEDTPVQQVADIMIRGNIRRVFVTRNKKVVGVISAQDLLTIIRDTVTT